MHKLQPEQVLDSEYSGQFGKESDFDEDFIKKLLKEWHFKYQYQHPIKFCVGTQSHHCRVDFLVSDEKGPLTIFENKLRIINERDLKPAVDQARSYALLLSLPSFVVASPEKILIYKLKGGKEDRVYECQTDRVEKQNEEMRKILLKI